MTRWLVSVDTRIVLVVDTDAEGKADVESEVRGRLRAGDPVGELERLEGRKMRVVPGSARRLNERERRP